MMASVSTLATRKKVNSFKCSQRINNNNNNKMKEKLKVQWAQ